MSNYSSFTSAVPDDGWTSNLASLLDVSFVAMYKHLSSEWRLQKKCITFLVYS